MEDDRVEIVRRLVFDHLGSRSLKLICDGWAVDKLARDIIRGLDRKSSLWAKWEGERETLCKAAAACWIPVEDLRDCLNRMDGPPLTRTDVEQRMRAFYEEPYVPYPKDDLREGCLAIYEREKAKGTDLPAIVGALQEHVEREEARLRAELQENYRRQQEEARRALEQRFLSGADCKWTPVGGSKELYCRINGRTYRLAPAADKKLRLWRINSIEDDKGIPIGTYGSRRDVTRTLEQVAYQPEPQR